MVDQLKSQELFTLKERRIRHFGLEVPPVPVDSASDSSDGNSGDEDLPCHQDPSFGESTVPSSAGVPINNDIHPISIAFGKLNRFMMLMFSVLAHILVSFRVAPCTQSHFSCTMSW